MTLFRGGGGALGRRRPTDWTHVLRYALAELDGAIPPRVEIEFHYKPWWGEDQGDRASCIGHACSRMMALLNARSYDWDWLWNQAKLIDEWPDTVPGDNNGTSVRAACDVLRTLGHCVLQNGKPCPVDLAEGIIENRWATKVAEIRGALAGMLLPDGRVVHTPVVLGTNWYTNFDAPVRHNGEWWIGVDATTGAALTGRRLGSVRGGHSTCLAGASDKRQGVLLLNSWGPDYPPVWVPYDVLQRLVDEDGEAAIVTDRHTR